MKKKFIYSICAIFIVISIVFMVMFVLSGKNIKQEYGVADLSGTWKVVASIDNESVTIIEDEFMVFDSEKVYNYRNNDSTPYASSKYKIKVGKNTALELSNLPRKYIMDIKSKNCISLYENPKKLICIIRYPNEDRTDIEFNPSDLIGKWNVIYRNTAELKDEVLEFSDSELKDYRNGETESQMIFSYFWNNADCFTVEKLNKSFKIYPLSTETLILIETDTADLWELQRMK